MAEERPRLQLNTNNKVTPPKGTPSGQTFTNKHGEQQFKPGSLYERVAAANFRMQAVRDEYIAQGREPVTTVAGGGDNKKVGRRYKRATPQSYSQPSQRNPKDNDPSTECGRGPYRKNRIQIRPLGRCENYSKTREARGRAESY